MDLNKLTNDRLAALYNALALEPAKADIKKADLIELCTTTNVAPKQIAHAIGDTPFNVRQALRAARKDIEAHALVHTHTMKTRWELTLAAAIDLFPALVSDKAAA